MNFLSPESILNQTILIDLPSLIFGSQHSDSFLAIEDTLKYKFDNVMNISKSGGHRLMSIQNYLRDRLTKLEIASDTFDLFNYWHIIQLGGIISAGMAFFDFYIPVLAF